MKPQRRPSSNALHFIIMHSIPIRLSLDLQCLIPIFQVVIIGTDGPILPPHPPYVTLPYPTLPCSVHPKLHAKNESISIYSSFFPMNHPSVHVPNTSASPAALVARPHPGALFRQP